jgi:ribonuclease E
VQAPAPILPPVQQAIAEPVVVTAAPVVVAKPAVTSSVDLEVMLQAAGLQMASTDPSKLRAVQDQSVSMTPPARLGREPKKLEVTPDQPLLQVETQR